MKYLIPAVLWLALASHAQSQPIFSLNGVAIRGYDPVAYFTENQPVEGRPEFSFLWQGAEWRFKDQANRDLFRENPEKYAPQFGGFCAYGVSENHKSPTDPYAFTVIDEKLYLNYSPKVKQLWSKDREMHIQRAETNWPILLNRKD
ncbi:MAG: YHS domain protein [Cyclobacteriaceae bacterium]|nr:YHS domain protein [Cyclobacteriaceae bacterium]